MGSSEEGKDEFQRPSPPQKREAMNDLTKTLLEIARPMNLSDLPNPFDLEIDHEENVQTLREAPSSGSKPQEARSPRSAADEGPRPVLRVLKGHTEL